MRRTAVAWPESFEKGRVQVGVRVRGAEQIALLEELALTSETCLEAGDARVVDSFGGLADRKALEHGARLQDLDRLVV